jgi:hypothetical protein
MSDNLSAPSGSWPWVVQVLCRWLHSCEALSGMGPHSLWDGMEDSAEHSVHKGCLLYVAA